MAMLAALSLSYAPNLAPVQSAARAATPLMQVGSQPARRCARSCSLMASARARRP